MNWVEHLIPKHQGMEYVQHFNKFGGGGGGGEEGNHRNGTSSLATKTSWL